MSYISLLIKILNFSLILSMFSYLLKIIWNISWPHKLLQNFIIPFMTFITNRLLYTENGRKSRNNSSDYTVSRTNNFGIGIQMNQENAINNEEINPIIQGNTRNNSDVNRLNKIY